MHAMREIDEIRKGNSTSEHACKTPMYEPLEVTKCEKCGKAFRRKVVF